MIVNEGTVLRIDLAVPPAAPPVVQSITVIGSEFSERTDPMALVNRAHGRGAQQEQ
jgi:hypothetical protein